jgi:hypothetical protein
MLESDGIHLRWSRVKHFWPVGGLRLLFEFVGIVAFCIMAQQRRDELARPMACIVWSVLLEQARRRPQPVFIAARASIEISEGDAL